MGIVGVSLILASVVYIIVRLPAWLSPMLSRWLGLRAPVAAPGPTKRRDDDADTALRIPGPGCLPDDGPSALPSSSGRPEESSSSDRLRDDRAAMPPPPIIQPPTIDVPDSPETTPKASASQPDPDPIPTFSLSDESSAPRPSKPSATAASVMPPPLPVRVPTLAQFPAANSPQRAARGPIPNRGSSPLAPSGGLAPPPTHSSKPQKPHRKVTLAPGHSPLDWARISGGSADLRGVGREMPYLRVPPSMLKRQTGRKGKDAWMAINGKVYNITPYAQFHPGGVPELMRGAGRDGTKLFGEVHPWVNYETMLAACLIGLLVDEPVGDSAAESEMDKMD
ncbi:cytochrome b5-like heme/steroid binding domain-containing protein [Hirsutella rhossiliensis]|uniref:Cytochrome b5-like heme/Steroid binding domain-containing protein n=1 Tax=Hirsutella rhossiliensis TaxID=111463 RepID=A0A9P8MVZ7_9HYPO|nr:cytochrome b5-like heme/Steroid binding domain-containing protein [Hirsutella rhossiliensis]KAH0962199.1 cytochrome b5-like heme/Steroid binding domain-containing protein [Hirsutella rhossiliensis]